MALQGPKWYAMRMNLRNVPGDSKVYAIVKNNPELLLDMAEYCFGSAAVQGNRLILNRLAIPGVRLELEVSDPAAMLEWFKARMPGGADCAQF